MKILINEFSKEINKKIIIDDLVDANLIDHKYIKRYFYSIKNTCQIFIYLFIDDKLFLNNETCHYLKKLLITINVFTKHSQKYFNLFIHILSKVPSLLLLFSNWN